MARELMDAYEHKRVLPIPLSTREPSFDLPTAYAVEAELTRLRRAGGRTTIGRKVGYANKAVWRALKLETLVWAHMYDDTVAYAADARAIMPVGRMLAPKIEPEIVFKLARRIDVGNLDPAAILGCVEWLAIGFEIVDSVFADWKFQPSDFVAAFGLHAALVVGEPRGSTRASSRHGSRTSGTFVSVCCATGYPSRKDPVAIRCAALPCASAS